MAQRQTRRRPSRPPPPTRYRAPTERAYGVALQKDTVAESSSDYAIAEAHRSSSETSGSLDRTTTQRRPPRQKTRRRGRGRPASIYDAVGPEANNTDSEPDEPAAADAATVADPPTEGSTYYAEAEAAPGTVPNIFARSKSKRGSHTFVVSKSIINSDGQLDQVSTAFPKRTCLILVTALSACCCFRKGPYCTHESVLTICCHSLSPPPGPGHRHRAGDHEEACKYGSISNSRRWGRATKGDYVAAQDPLKDRRRQMDPAKHLQRAH